MSKQEITENQADQTKSDVVESQNNTPDNTSTLSEFNPNKEISWYKSNIVVAIGAIFTIATIVVTVYEYYVIPLRINEMTQVKKENIKLNEKLENANKKLEQQKNELNKLKGEINNSHINTTLLLNKVAEREGRLAQITQDINNCNNTLKLHKYYVNNFNIQQEINKLIGKIEKNDYYLNYHSLTEEQRENHKQSNDRFKNMISEYQKKLSCLN